MPNRRKGVRVHRSSRHAAYDRAHIIYEFAAFRLRLNDSECFEQSHRLRSPTRDIEDTGHPRATHRPLSDLPASATFGSPSDSTHRGMAILAILAQGVATPQGLPVHNQAQGQGEVRERGEISCPVTKHDNGRIDMKKKEDNDDHLFTDDPDELRVFTCSIDGEVNT